MRTETNQALLRLGLNIRAIRRTVKLTQAALAKRARVSVPHLSGIERGQRSPSILCVARIAKALRTKLGKLCEGIDEKAGQPGRRQPQ